MNANETARKVLAQEGISMTEQQLLRVVAKAPPPSNGIPPGRQRGRIMTAWVALWTFVFEALREAYWVLDRDAKVRSQGVQTAGRVLKTRTQEHTDPESGTSYTHYVTYEFQVDAKSHTVEKQVSRYGTLKRDMPIKVYFLPDTYPIASAIDKEPRALAKPAERILEARPSQPKATNGSGPH